MYLTPFFIFLEENFVKIAVSDNGSLVHGCTFGLDYFTPDDPDNYPRGSPSTNNGRDFGSLAPEDWVHSVGSISGLTLGL